MADPKRISRDQLAKFLPNHDAIKSFEQLFEYVTETLPTILLEMQYIEMSVNGREQSGTTNRLNDIEMIQPRPANQSNLENKISDIEAMQPRMRNLGSLENRVSDIELMQARPVNIRALEDRILELEAQVVRRENNDALLRRIEDLEKLVGV
jgi:hypothetical protein